MTRLPFEVEATKLFPVGDAVYLREGDNIHTELEHAVVQSIWTDLEIKIGDHTMFLAAWLDPEHWAEEWAAKLGVEHEEAPEAVLDIITMALETDQSADS